MSIRRFVLFHLRWMTRTEVVVEIDDSRDQCDDVVVEGGRWSTRDVFPSGEKRNVIVSS